MQEDDRGGGASGSHGDDGGAVVDPGSEALERA